MNIWQFDPVSLTPYYDINVCQALADDGNNVRFVTSPYLYDPNLTYPPEITVDLAYFRLLSQPVLSRLPVLRKALRGLLYPLGHRRMIAEIKAQRPDVIHMQWSRFPRFDAWFARAVKQMRIPLVHTIHDVEPLFGYGLFAGNLRAIYEPYVDAFIVHTEENRARFIERYPAVPAHKVHVIPLILTRIGGQHESQAGSRAQARAALNIDPSAFVVLFFGNIKPYKGLDVLANTIPQVAAQDEQVEFWIVGRPGSEADRLLLKQLEPLERVHILAHYIPSEDVWKYHEAADVVVFPYHQISQSGALATALSFGCAVIVTDVGGLPDMVHENGWVIPPNDPAALASTLHTAAHAPDLLDTMRERSRALNETIFSPHAIAQQHLAIYQQVIEAVSR